LLVLFYALPWLRWNGHQALLLDINARRFDLFGWTLWPGDVGVLIGLLAVLAVGLALLTHLVPPHLVRSCLPADAGVVPSTGSRTAWPRSCQCQPCARPGSRGGCCRSLWTGITFVGLFSPIAGLLAAAPNAGWSGWETFWVLFYAAATWGNAGFLREQVCRSLCPFARMQPLLIDPYTTHAVRRAPRRTARHAPSGHGGVLGRGRGLRPDHRGLRVPRRASAAGRTDAHLQRRSPGRLHRVAPLCQRLPDATGHPPGTAGRLPGLRRAVLDACSRQQHQAGSARGWCATAVRRHGRATARQWWRPRTLALLSMLLALLACGAWRLL
jgi:hypothetical protein